VRIERRALLAGAGAVALAIRRARAEPPAPAPDLDLREVEVDGGWSRLFVLAVPRHLAVGVRVPLVVLLHGLGETGDSRMGAWAWVQRYGLSTAYEGLREAGTLRGMVLACPYMPNLPVADPHALDDYARWVVETVIPRARAEAKVAFDRPSLTYLGGVSLGGHFSLEVVLRRPDAFGAWAGVQTAIGRGAGERYAQRLAPLVQGGRLAVLVETSTEDPFRPGSEALARGLSPSGAATTFVVLPGPHDQPWLRRSGTPRMLQWLDDRPRPERRLDPPDRRAASE
jgi:enterochelin esterase-like enzyme